MAKEHKKGYADYSLEEIISELEALDAELGRQHGREGTKYSDPEKEKRRLWNNLVSRRSRNARKEYQKRQDSTYKEILKLASDADEYGIRPIDERRYVRCFHSGYVGEVPERIYVIRMTGLTLNQIRILQKRTNLSPNPPVSDKEASADEKRRERTGDYY